MKRRVQGFSQNLTVPIAHEPSNREKPRRVKRVSLLPGDFGRKLVRIGQSSTEAKMIIVVFSPGRRETLKT
jgi:hypothetical protein